MPADHTLYLLQDQLVEVMTMLPPQSQDVTKLHSLQRTVTFIKKLHVLHVIDEHCCFIYSHSLFS